jgi:VCBS repeat-containing protein
VSGPDAGQPFTYTNWHQGEPNDIDHPPYDIGEHFLQFRSDGTWNDEQGPIVESGAMTDGYVIETTPLTSDPTVVPGTSDVEGYIAFTDPNSGDALTAAATPEGSNYIGTFVLDPVSKSGDTATLDFQFNLASDQINLAPGETLTQSYEVSVANGQNTLVNQSVSVTIGGPGNDNFVFAPGIGTDTIVNVNAQADTIDLSHFANIQSLQQVAAAITSDVHGDAVIELGHNDSITLPGVTANYLQQHLQSVVHVHA